MLVIFRLLKSLEGIRYEHNNVNTAVATFIEDGYLVIKFSNYGAEIKYSLIEKSAEEEPKKDELKGYIGSYQSIGNYSFQDTTLSNMALN